ncbi:MAG: hypothetical protein WCG73_02560 [Candidatus Moraniibacteriota bacterium]
MDQDIQQKFKEQDEKLDRIYASVEKTRKYFLWTMIGTIITFLVPLIGLAFAIPFFLGSLSTAYGL